MLAMEPAELFGSETVHEALPQQHALVGGQLLEPTMARLLLLLFGLLRSAYRRRAHLMRLDAHRRLAVDAVADGSKLHDASC